MDRDTRIIISLTLLTVFLIVFLAPKPSPEPLNQPLSGEIEIGVITATSSELEKYLYLAGLVEAELNQLCNTSGLNASFSFTVVDGATSAATALSNAQYFHESGVDLLVGGGWASQLWAMRDYINTRGMVIISPSSTNPQEPMILADAVFRLSPHDFRAGDIMATVVSDYGIDKVVILERDDAWASGIDEWFTEKYLQLGGSVVARVKYPPETASDFGSYLEEAVSQLDSQTGDLGVLYLSFGEINRVLEESDAYPSLANYTWFGAILDTHFSMRHDTMHPSIAPNQIPVLTNTSSPIINDYESRFSENLSFYDANIYDSCMIMGLSVIEANSVNTSQVIKVLPRVAEEYVGLTGPCGLDEYGDRRVFTTGIYAMGYNPGFEWELLGYHHSPSNTIEWLSSQGQ